MSRRLSCGTIVVVEDDESVRRSLTLLLRARGFSVDVFRSGIELLASRRLPEADCLVIDYKMPNMNGLDLLRSLRDQGLNTPALMITGYFSNTLSSEAAEAGYDSVFEKPSFGVGLLDRIQSLMPT